MRLFSRPSHIFLSVFLVLFLTATADSARANIITDFIKKKAIEEIAKRVGDAAELNAPLHLDQATAFASAPAPENFHPHLLETNSTSDINQPLAPGDYVMPVVGYCTAVGVPSPHQGLGAKIASLQGKDAKAVASLLTRGTLENVPVTTLQAMVWRIEDGLPVTQWSDDDQATLHRLIPEYEQSLNGDSLQQIQSTYDKYAKKIKLLPPLDSLLANMGAPGKLILEIKQTRQYLADKSIANERLVPLLFEQAANQGTPVAEDGEPSPWAEIKPGIIARFTTLEGADHKNRFEFRVLPTAIKDAPVAAGVPRFQTVQADVETAPLQYFPTIGSILYDFAMVGGRALVTGGTIIVEGVTAAELAPVIALGGAAYLVYSISQSAQQPLIYMVMPPNGTFQNRKPDDKESKVSEETKQAIDDLKEGATEKPKEVGDVTPTWDKPGGLDQAERDFGKLPGEKGISKDGKVGVSTLPDGTTISIRPISGKDGLGPPTIQINTPDGKVIKIRYR